MDVELGEQIGDGALADTRGDDLECDALGASRRCFAQERITETLSMMNAPKLMNKVDVATSMKVAMKPTAETARNAAPKRLLPIASTGSGRG